MYKIAFFDTKSYDKNAFLKYSEELQECENFIYSFKWFAL